MRRTGFTLLLLALSAVMLQAQDLRESVCIVEAQYTTEAKTTLGDFALWLSRKGFTSESRVLTAYKNGTSGSGVVIEADGKRYVVTNRHVVGYAREVKLSFALRDTTLVWNCPVLTEDINADLALISLPETCKQIALPIVTNPLEDGQDIVAAGFPGLDGKPSWQLSKGTVSNAYLRIDDCKHPLVQHTAAIDPGSSGGPLLVKTDAGYQVVGVNTMKAFRRDNVGLSIPTSTLQAFLATASAPVLPDHQLLSGLTLNGETWSKMLDKMEKACVDSLKHMQVEMPLDVVSNTLALDCTPEVKPVASKAAASKNAADDKGDAKKSSVYDSNFGNYLYARIEYTNYFGRNQQVNVLWEDNISAFLYGVGLMLTMDNCMPAGEPEYSQLGLGIGLRLGTQVPLHMGKDHYALPRFTLTPHFNVLSFMSGLSASSYSLAGVPISIGSDFGFSVGDYLLCVGFHYVYDLRLFRNPSAEVVFDNNRKLLKDGAVGLVGASGLSVNFSFGW